MAKLHTKFKIQCRNEKKYLKKNEIRYSNTLKTNSVLKIIDVKKYIEIIVSQIANRRKLHKYCIQYAKIDESTYFKCRKSINVFKKKRKRKMYTTAENQIQSLNKRTKKSSRRKISNEKRR